MEKWEEKNKQLDDLYFRILPAANKRYNECSAEVVRLGKIEKGIKTLRINAVELRHCAEKELYHFEEKYEKLAKEKNELKNQVAKTLFLKIETGEDAVKKMSTEEIKKRIDVLEKFKTFKEAVEKRDTAYNNFKVAELEFSTAQEAYCVAVKFL